MRQSSMMMSFSRTMGLIDYRRWQVLAALIVVILFAAVVRLGGIFHDLPFSYYGDELHFIRRSMAMGTGDLNPHWFNKPAFLMYVLLFFYGLMFIAGYLTGSFASPDAFGAYFLEDMGAFILISRLVVFVFAILSIWVLFETARRVHGSVLAGWITAFVAAILPPLVISSQSLKADIPAGLFVLVSVGFYLRTYHVNSLKWPVFAAIAAGFAMATKYYGIILIPIFCLVEFLRIWTHQERLPRVIGRISLIVFLFFLTFFLVSPFSFLDPTLQNFIIFKIKTYLDPTYIRYEPDAAKTFQYSVVSIPAATLDVVDTLIERSSIGAPFLILSTLGLGWMLTQRAYRWHACVILGPCLIFLFLCVTIWAYHASPRHFNAIYGLLLLGLYPGALFVVRLVPFMRARSEFAAAVLIILISYPSVEHSFAKNQTLNRVDSRLIATQWIHANIEPGARVLLDDYGPEMLPDSAAIARRTQVLQALPDRDAFTIHQSKRLDLIERFPPAHAFNFDELGHPWWSPVELTNEEMRGAREHRTLGNPLSEYEPRPVAGYRMRGYRYIITNSEAQSHYADPVARANHPSYARLYDELNARDPLITFDPSSWGGKGPMVQVYKID